MNAGDQPLALHGECTDDGPLPLTYSIVSGVTHGSLVGTPDGNATYTPNVGFAGTDQLTYRATDGAGLFTDATTTIVVNPAPASGLPPSCPADARVFVVAGGSVQLVGNCSDPDGDPIASCSLVFDATLQLNGGSLIPNGICQAVFTPAASTTTASFRYVATDSRNQTSVPRTVTITVIPDAPGPSSVSTGTTTTDTDPFNAAVQTSSAQPVVIGERGTSVPPSDGFSLLSTEWNIQAPAQTAADPLRLTFLVDHTQLPLSGRVEVFRDLATNPDPIGACTGPAGQASPDPCVVSRDTVNAEGDVAIVVLSSHASQWNLGVATVVMPTDKAQCKGDGWKAFHDGTKRFRNQGDCVSYVATRGKNGPAR
jgi:hypothetical protein